MSFISLMTKDPVAQPISIEALRQRVPSLFATEAHESRSERFAPIPTWDIVRGLENEGWMVTSAQQQRVRDDGRRGFTKHLLRLRHRDSTSRVLNGTYPELVLQNGNDGSSSYLLRGGLFRLICLNGMVIGDHMTAPVRVAHRGDVQSKVIEGSFRVLNNVKAASEVIQPWQQLMLSAPEQEAFARSAHTLRFGEVQEDGSVVTTTPIKPQQLLGARRWDDRGDDLWRVYNRVQENIIRGGISGVGQDAQGRVRRVSTRAVRSITQDVKLNAALFDLAEAMAALKA